MELWHIAPGRKFDADGRWFYEVPIVFRQLFANFSRFDTDYWIIRRVVAHRPTEHFGPYHPLAQAIESACNRVFYDQSKEILSPPAAGKHGTRKHSFEMIAH
jgi:hypothetical protein